MKVRQTRTGPRPDLPHLPPGLPSGSRALIAGAALFASLSIASEVTAQATAPAHGEHADPHASARNTSTLDEAGFIRAARAGTERYRDIATARADGYRRIGGELPSLGEHWVHNGRALADTLDPARPPILVYATARSRPTLAGVGYIRFLAPGEAYPAFPSSVAHAWHDHNGGVDDEVLPLGHLAPTTAAPKPSTSPRLRIAVMHAWIGVDNPAGVWTSENWGLPYMRAGLRSAAGPGGTDARALSLIDGADYYLRAMASVGALDEREREHAQRVVHARASRVHSLIAGGARDTTSRPAVLAPREVDALAAEWDGMWADVLAGLRPGSAARLRPLIDALGPRGG